MGIFRTVHHLAGIIITIKEDIEGGDIEK